MKTQKEVMEQLVGRAGEDDAFRTRLLADPKTVIEQEFGTPVPEGFRIEIHEDGADVGHLVLPPTGRLSDAELETVAAGNAQQVRERGIYWWARVD